MQSELLDVSKVVRQSTYDVVRHPGVVFAVVVVDVVVVVSNLDGAVVVVVVDSFAIGIV